MNITTMGIDIAKNVFHVCGIDRKNKIVLNKKLTRKDFAEFLKSIPANCMVVMEACGGSHYWGRQLLSLGINVKLIPGQYVRPFLLGNKTDQNDAKAIAEAAQRPDMRFVPIKTLQQQDYMAVHRIRERLIGQRTALSNEIRGMLAERGFLINKGFAALKRALPEILSGEYEGDEITGDFLYLLNNLWHEFKNLEEEIKKYEQQVAKIYRENEACQLIGEIPGVGHVTATAIIAAFGDSPKTYGSSRKFASSIGLVPKESSSGGKQRLFSISKHGNSYIRRLLVHGARSVILRASKEKTEIHQWVTRIKERRGYNRASVALANKNARVIWALLMRRDDYQSHKRSRLNASELLGNAA